MASILLGRLIMLRLSFVALVGTAVLGGVACGGKGLSGSSGTGGSAGAAGAPFLANGGSNGGAAPSLDAGSGGGAATPDAGRDAAGDGCHPFDVATECLGTGGLCEPTWADVLANPNPICVFVAYPISWESRGDCGAYHVRQVVEGGDNGAEYDYDLTTGKLVGINGCDLASCGCSPLAIPDDCYRRLTPVCVYDGNASGPDGGTACLSSAGAFSVKLGAACPSDGGTACYASCTVSGFKYIGCLSNTTTTCHPSCADCPAE